MGYNTGVLILNDAADLLKSDPEAGRKIYEGILMAPRWPGKATDVSIGNHCNAVSILPSVHADNIQIIAIGGNCIMPVSTLYGHWAAMRDPDLLVKQLAKSLGYRLVKLPTG